jgi:putative hydrolase of the HAD superfamily
MIKAIIFDCFGVLIGKGFEQTYRMAGGDPVRDREFIESTLGQANLGLITDEQFRANMAEHVGISKDDWNTTIRQAELLDTDLLKYIVQLRATYKTAILSNANNRVLDTQIGEQWLKDAFDDVVISAEVGLVKPDPRVYQLVANRLDVALNDDRASFVEIANNLGMRALVYETFKKFKEDLTPLLA